MLVTAETLTAGSHKSHAPGRRQEDDFNLVAHTLKGEGHDGSEDGTGRGVPLVTQALTGTYANGGADDNKAQGGFLVPDVARSLTAPSRPRYDGDTETFVLQDVRGGTRDKTDDGQGIGIRQGDGPMYTLDATQQHAVAYQCQGSNVGEMGTLRAGNGALTGGVPFVKTTRAHSAEDAEVWADGEASPTLNAFDSGESRTSALAVAFTERTRKYGRTFESQEDLAYALTNPGSGGRTHSRQIAVGMGVRRLTPRECERLQGFPDNWTLLDDKTADSPRYRAAGNAVAVPVVEWIAGRIAETDAARRREATRDA